MSRFSFGARSIQRLETCHPSIRAVMSRAIELTPFDFTIVAGWRGAEEQNQAYADGRSQLRYPQSKHNAIRDGKPESLAVDIAPWMRGQIVWGDRLLFCVLAGVVFSAAHERGVLLRWGGDFRQDWQLSAAGRFRDLPHFELV